MVWLHAGAGIRAVRDEHGGWGRAVRCKGGGTAGMHAAPILRAKGIFAQHADHNFVHPCMFVLISTVLVMAAATTLRGGSWKYTGGSVRVYVFLSVSAGEWCQLAVCLIQQILCRA